MATPPRQGLTPSESVAHPAAAAAPQVREMALQALGLLAISRPGVMVHKDSPASKLMTQGEGRRVGGRVRAEGGWSWGVLSAGGRQRKEAGSIALRPLIQAVSKSDIDAAPAALPQH